MTIVDVEAGRLVPRQTVVIVNTRIQAVGPFDRVSIPADAHVVEATGKYLIPGLWDTHVHTLSSTAFLYPYFITRGVTGVVEMSTPWLDSLLRWRRDVAAGVRVGPRSVVTGGFIGMPEDAEPAMASFSAYGTPPSSRYVGVTTVAEARQAVRAIKASGADFVKIHSGIFPREIFFAIAAEARQLGLPLAGHLTASVTPAEASDSGQRSLEHVGLQACRLPHEEPGTGTEAMTDSEAIADTALRARCRAIADRLTRNNSWLMPAAGGAIRGLPLCASGAVAADTAGCTAVPPSWAALPIVAGTDLAVFSLDMSGGQALLVPPPSTDLTGVRDRLLGRYPLQSELELLVAKGMTPLQALRSATLNPARMLGATDSLGTVVVGKLADLVLLAADPLMDVHNTTAIDAVVANGRYFDRAALDGWIAALGRATAADPYPSAAMVHVDEP